MDLKLGSIDLGQIKLSNLYNTYLGMNSREQTVALVVSGIVLILLIIIPITVASGKIGSLEKEIEKGNVQIKDVVREIDVYQSAMSQLLASEKKIAGGFDSSIATTMESLASKVGIADKIESLKEKPSTASDVFDEVSVDVRLQKVSLADLIKYLESIEQEPNKFLRLKKVEIKPRYDNKQQLDASFSVSTYRLLETSEGTE